MFRRQEVHEKKLRRMQSLCELPRPVQLEWNLSSNVENVIAAATDSIDRSVQTVIITWKNLNVYAITFMNIIIMRKSII